MLSAQSLKEIDIELAKYPAEQRRSAVMGALRIAQTELGWLKPETIEFVANYIGIPAIAAYLAKWIDDVSGSLKTREYLE